MSQTNPHEPSLDRRKLIRGTGALGLGTFLADASRAAPSTAGLPNLIETHAQLASRVGDLLEGVCLLTPSAAQGPFYLDLNHVRQDITQGLPGLPVILVFKVVDANCAPVESAYVDVWHTDAEGRYSGFASEGTEGETFMRGAQISGPEGLVFFQTVFPGWYPVRTAHIHVKVYLGDDQALTTQTYFPDFLSAAVYDLVPPYDAKGPAPVTNQNDGSYQAAAEMLWGQIPGGPLAIWTGLVLGLP